MSAVRTRTLEEYHADYQQSVADPDAFWAAAAEPFTWHRKWDTVRGGEFSPAGTSTWYAGATLNLTENCLDRHLEQRANKLALIFEGTDTATVMPTTASTAHHVDPEMVVPDPVDGPDGGG